MFTYNLVDTSFSHEKSSVAGVTPITLTWDRVLTDPNAPYFFTNEQILTGRHLEVPKHLRNALLIESQAIIPQIYRESHKFIDQYARFFTHSSELLAKYENTVWIPGGGIWVGGQYAGGTIGIQPKTKNISILSSNKLHCPLHRQRFFTASRLKFERRNVDVYLQYPGSKKRISTYQTLGDYRFTICMENFQDTRYFTEKLLNAFATGTIPVYLGATNLEDYFDVRGVITFKNYAELVHEILPSLNENLYETLREPIQENLNTALRYRSIEDYIITKM